MLSLPKMIKWKFGGNPLPDPNTKIHKRNSNLSGAKSLLYMHVSGKTTPSNTKCAQKTRSKPSNNLIVSQWTQRTVVAVSQLISSKC